MFDGEFASADALIAQTLLPLAPTSQMVLDGLEHHSEAPSAKAPICL